MPQLLKTYQLGHFSGVSLVSGALTVGVVAVDFFGSSGVILQSIYAVLPEAARKELPDRHFDSVAHLVFSCRYSVWLNWGWSVRLLGLCYLKINFSNI